MIWSAWHRISELKVHPAASCGVGVYQVRAANENHTPIPIQRACGIDTEGILYIGCGSLLHRIGRLLKISEANPKSHHNFIWVYQTFHLERICNRRFLDIRWMECADYGNEERRLLDEYKRRTGDIPPGNRKLEPYTAPNMDAMLPMPDIQET